MNRIKLILILFFTIGFLFINCEGGEGTCPPNEGIYFDIIGIGSLVHHYRNTQTSAPPLQDNAKISFEDYYGLILRYSTNYLSATEPKFKRTGFGQLYALSCIFSGERGSKKETLKKVSVITLNDFNSQYKQGDTINELLKTDGVALNEYIAANDSILIEYQNFGFTLNQAPTLSSEFKVKVFV